MTDRELLEKAALAAGYKWRWYAAPVGQLFQIHDGFLWNYWNPLREDGDAFRLLVALKLEPEWWKTGVSINRDDIPPGAIHHIGDDARAATRRAIVRAAAAIEDSTGTEKQK
jgi:hypothetical protein